MSVLDIIVKILLGFLGLLCFVNGINGLRGKNIHVFGRYKFLTPDPKGNRAVVYGILYVILGLFLVCTAFLFNIE